VVIDRKGGAFLLLTADLFVEAEARALGADAFFQKPVGFQRFLALGDLDGSPERVQTNWKPAARRRTSGGLPRALAFRLRHLPDIHAR
jgi:hypothetical protein